MKQVNLIIEELKPKFDYLALPFLLKLSAFLLLLCLLAVAYLAYKSHNLEKQNAENHKTITTLNQDISKFKAIIAKKSRDPKLELQVKRTRKAIEDRRKILALLGNSRNKKQLKWSDVMAGLARQSNENVWLVHFVVEDDNIDLQGRLSDPFYLTKYIDLLNKDPAFVGLRFSSVNVVAQNPMKTEVDENGNPIVRRNFSGGYHGGTNNEKVRVQVDSKGGVNLPMLSRTAAEIPNFSYAEFWLHSEKNIANNNIR